ncbi:MAG: inorganic phosphate transporter, partial [Simkaniaceae bacterium]|nr:inorganic phosphate transporter [Simkaniaceae bacterium]
MSIELLLIILVLAAGFYMSWTIGANDVSNAMGTSVGSGALTLKRAVIIAAILEFSGAALLGSNVSETLQKGIIDLNFFTHDPSSLLIGMFSALLATAIWLQLASFFGWPVSTTHAIVGAIMGFGIVVGGSAAIQWKEVLSISVSWILSPGLSALISFIIFSAVQKKVLYAFHPIDATKRLMPYLVFIVLFTFFITLGFSGVKNFDIHFPILLVLGGAFIIASLASLLTAFLVKHAHVDSQFQGSVSLKHRHQLFSLNKALKHLQRLKLSSSGETRDEVSAAVKSMKALSEKIAQQMPVKKEVSDYQVVEKLFGYLQILSACFVAFAHGANDVANAIGPVASAIQIIKNPQNLALSAKIPFWLLALGG